MKVRIIKTDDCSICQSYLPKLDKVGFEYSVYDADADENQKELDEWGIDELPVVQIVSDDGKEVLHQFPPRATLGPRSLNYKMKELAK